MISEIHRRIQENNPIEVRRVNHLTMRVCGFVCGNPVYHPDDDAAFWEWVESRYQCHVCLDTKRVYLHGEEKLTLEERVKEKGNPCPACQ